MLGILDEDLLNGAHEVWINYRPRRFVVPLAGATSDIFQISVENLCQVWSGANFPLVGVSDSGGIDPLYASRIPGSDIDDVLGMHPFDIAYLPNQRVTEDVTWPIDRSQLAVALFPYRLQKDSLPLEVVDLEPTDPWRSIYSACLGTLPTEPSPALLREGHLRPDLTFSDFLEVSRVSVTGSLKDLCSRLEDRQVLTPRQQSLVYLSNGNAGSSELRSGRKVLPNPNFYRHDAGPNIVVVCSPEDTRDVFLLWNLRAALGDHRVLPIGIPASEISRDLIQRLASLPTVARNGSAVSPVYVTSASISAEDLSARLGEAEPHAFTVARAEDLIDFGSAAGIRRSEVVTWLQGRAQVMGLAPEAHRALFEERAVSDLAMMQTDVAVESQPFPNASDLRLSAGNYDAYAGSFSTWAGPRYRSEVREIVWPSRLLSARAVATQRGLKLNESEPGRASRVALEGMVDLYEIGNLAHAPLLGFLEERAARQGFGWYKKRLGEAAPPPTPAGVEEDLPEFSFHELKKVIGNSDPATKQWLTWAEKVNFVVKGFPLQCQLCAAKQWVPVAAFSPPLICRGCGKPMDRPFGEASEVHFKYRLSERLRRVYEHDAMGHILALRYFHLLFSGARGSLLIGQHPGMEVKLDGEVNVLGEADVLMLTRAGEFIPVEVKRSASGMVEAEVDKLDVLCNALLSPWSAIAVCQYSFQLDDDVSRLEIVQLDGTRHRVVLTYESLLTPHPVFTLGGDPFAWKAMTHQEVEAREKDFVKLLVSQRQDGYSTHLDYDMTRRRPRSSEVIGTRSTVPAEPDSIA